MNLYLLIILLALVGRYALAALADWLNLRHVQEAVPAEFAGCYDAEKYRKGQQYLRDSTWMELIDDTVGTVAILAFVLLGGFNVADRLARSFELGSILTGLIFGAVLVLASRLLQLPFSVYETFVLEERYGFNRTTVRTFILDLAKALLLTALLGGAVFAGVIWFFDTAGARAWLYCWLAVTGFEAVLVFVAPYVIMPLFNKFVPLKEGDLRTAIETYAHSQRFKMRGVFTMDGSRRSARTNAFFTGFGRSRRIVLFDTLIEKHTVPELVAVVAHEMGHYRKHHILWGLLRMALLSGLTFLLLSFFINNRGLFDAFRMEQLSVYASLVFFGFLYAPVGLVVSMAENAISRRHEYEADAYAARTTGDAEAMIAALKKLSVDNLSNLTPHPLKVFLGYSHPPVLARIAALRGVTGS